MSLRDEIEANFDRFITRTDNELTAVRKALAARRDTYLDCYTRVAALNGWRELLLGTVISASSLSFFLEAQNDALTSLVFARFGSWRSANKSLRDCIENVLFCLYYKDHPVELKLWNLNQFRIGFSATHKYLNEHPDIRRMNRGVTGLEQLKSEYSTLSKAVHGAHAFRMSDASGTTRLWTEEVVSANAWRTRERSVLTALHLLLITMFREHLQGARLLPLREVLALTIPTSKHPLVRTALKVNL
jgi:hypothetical protein